MWDFDPFSLRRNRLKRLKRVEARTRFKQTVGRFHLKRAFLEMEVLAHSFREYASEYGKRLRTQEDHRRRLVGWFFYSDVHEARIGLFLNGSVEVGAVVSIQTQDPVPFFVRAEVTQVGLLRREQKVLSQKKVHFDYRVQLKPLFTNKDEKERFERFKSHLQRESHRLGVTELSLGSS